MALRDVLNAINESNPAVTASKPTAEIADPATVLNATEDVFDAPMMIMNQIHEA